MSDTVVIDRFGNERILRDGEIVGDGERLRFGMTAMDSLQRAVFESMRERRVADTRVVDARERAYRDVEIDETNAYRRPPGSYPLSAMENSYCTIDGAPGHLVPAKDGSPWLECVADEVGAAKAKTDALPQAGLPLGDALARLRDAREQAYREVEARDATAWTRPIQSGIAK
jgi:hypothetical protein